MTDQVTRQMGICKEIREALDKVCPTGNFRECSIEGCSLSGRCNKNELDPTNKFRSYKHLLRFKFSLSNLLKKNTVSYFIPTNQKKKKKPKFLTRRVANAVNLFIGDIEEHELLIGEPELQNELVQSKNLKEVLKVMDKAYLKKHGKMYKAYGMGYGPEWKFIKQQQ